MSWDDVESAFENRIKTGVITNRRYLDLLKFMKDAKQEFIEKVCEILKEPLKVNTVLAAEYMIVKDGEETVEIKYFNTKTAPIYSTMDLNEWFVMNVQNPIDTDMEEFQERESGWTLKSILNLVVNIYKFNPMRGNSYIDLPPFIKNKKACINVENKDNECFKWAILSALHPAKKNANRAVSYVPYKNDPNFKGIDFPVDPRKVGKFEKQNDVSVNVYYLNKKQREAFDVLPRHLTSDKKEKHVNLLLVESHYVDDEDEDGSTLDDDVNIEFKFHYVWIKNLSRLCSQQLSPRNHKTFVCDRCLYYFWTEEKLTKHVIDCEKINQCKITLPNKKNNTLEFTNFGFKNRVPFVIYADFECILKPVIDNERAYQHHVPFSVGYYIKCSYDNSLSEYKSYRQEGEQAESPAKWFVQSLHSLAVILNDSYKNPKPMNNLTSLEKIIFERARLCHICEKPFTKNDVRVCDHCHFMGK